MLQAPVKMEEHVAMISILIFVIAFQAIQETTVKLVNDFLIYFFIAENFERIVKIVEY